MPFILSHQQFSSQFISKIPDNQIKEMKEFSSRFLVSLRRYALVGRSGLDDPKAAPRRI